MKSMRVYLSSTFEDLKEYRESVFTALEKGGLAVARMEAYTAADERPLDLCLRDVAQSDIYVGLYAWRYGYEPPAAHGNPDGESITHLEYRRAESAGLRKLLFFAHPDTRADWPAAFRDDATGAGLGGEKLNRLRASLGTEKTGSFFRGKDELATLVLAAIMRSGMTGRVYNVPPLPPGFIARPALVGSVVQALMGREGASGASTLVQGAGGFGKTTLAIAACHDAALVHAYPDGMLWTSLGERPDLGRILGDLHVLAAGTPAGVAGVEEAAQALAKVLQGQRCLVIVDDAWREQDLAPFLRLDGPRLLVTTRNRALIQQSGQPDWPEVAVDMMEPGEAAAVLGRGLTPQAAAAQALQRMATDLGCWPLLLDLANARLREEQKSGRGSVDRCIEFVATLFRKRGVLGFDRRDSSARNAAVASSVDVGLELAEQMHPGLAHKAAELSVFPENVTIAAHVLCDLWGLDEFDVEEEVLRPLDNLCLLRWDREAGEVRLHMMIQRALQTRLQAADGGVAAVHRRLLKAWGDPLQLPHPHAWRWFAWHCIGAGDAPLLSTLLLRPDWIAARLAAATRKLEDGSITDIAAVLGDYALVPADAAVSQVARALRASAHVLKKCPGAVYQQLFGRLSGSAMAPLELLANSALAQANQRDALSPSLPTLAPPGALEATLPAPGVRVQGARALPDGKRVLSWFSDCTLGLWDLELGAIVHRLHGHSERVMDVLTLADGRRALSWSGDCTLRLWDLERGGESLVLEGHDTPVRDVQLLNGGRRALSMAFDESVLLWDVDTGGAPVVLARYEIDIDSLLPLPDGQRVLAWGRDQYRQPEPTPADQDLPGAQAPAPAAPDRWVLRLWNPESGAVAEQTVELESAMEGAVLLPDGRRALSWSRDETLRVWDLGQLDAPRVLASDHPAVRGALPLTDGRHVLSWGEWSLRLWDLQTDVRPEQLGSLFFRVSGVVLLPDSQRALSWWGKELRLWYLMPEARTARRSKWHLLRREIDPDEFFAPLQRLDEEIGEALLLPGGRRALSWDALTLRVWDLERAGEGQRRSGHPDPIAGAAVLADGQRALTWTQWRQNDCTVRLWDLTSGTSEAVLDPSATTRAEAAGTISPRQSWSDPLEGVLRLPDGRRLVFWTREGAVHLWDLAQAGALPRRIGKLDRLLGVLILSDGRRAVAWGSPPGLHLWDMESDGDELILAGHRDFVVGALALPGGRLLTWSRHTEWSFDTAARIWSLTGDGDPVVLVDDFGAFTHAVLLPGGQRALSWSGDPEDRRLLLWDLERGAQIMALAGHDGAVYDVLVLPGGERVLSCGEDQQMLLWDLVHGGAPLMHWDLAQRHSERGGLKRPSALLLPGGQRALYWCADHTMRIVNLVDFRTLQVLQGHVDVIAGALALPDGRRVLSWSLDRSVRLWDTGLGVQLGFWFSDAVPTSVLLSEDGTRAVVGDVLGQLQVLRIAGLPA